jgi:hypothetical protein
VFHTPLTTKRGVRVAKTDGLVCRQLFLLFHDASFAEIGALLQRCQIFGDEAQGFLPLQSRFASLEMNLLAEAPKLLLPNLIRVRRI